MTRDAVAALVEEAEAKGRILGVRMPVEDEDADEPWRIPPSRRREPLPITDTLPSRITIVLADQVYIDRSELPPSMVTRLVRLAERTPSAKITATLWRTNWSANSRNRA